ncbi:hypothetical protein [Micromonospora wenchangensis]|uniref:hypothetical protein n=1 Tax=Micromonospora wenchangensis TaxID=1185415 RepID=UPI0038184F9B
MTDELAGWLRQQILADRDKASTDDRHWSEVPDEVFAGPAILAKLDADLAVLDFLERAARPGWAGYAVAGDAEAALRRWSAPYAHRPGYQERWRP